MLIMNINKKLVPMKMHYLFYSGCIATILSFGSTYAKQLGYSKITVGYIMMCLFIISMITKPIVGAIVDKFHVKKFIFLSFIFFTGASSFFLMFVPELPLEYSTELDCNETTILKIYTEDTKRLSYCDQKKLTRNHDDGMIKCKLNCSNHELLFSQMFTAWSLTTNNLDPISNYVRVTELQNNNLTAYLFLDIKPNQTGFYNFGMKILYEDVNNITQLTWPSCHIPTKVSCRMQCLNQTIMELSTISKSQKSILFMPEFWQFFSLLCVFWISQSGIWTIQDPICFDLLDREENFGKQRCWTSIGWGTVAMLSGWLVDYYSVDDLHKNYTPVSLLIIVFMSFNLIFAYNIEIVEFKPSKNTCQNVFKLFSKVHELSFFLWVLSLGVFGSMTMSYLFWYVEDVASEFRCNQLPWIKTLQGLSQALQSFAGEMPIFFCSGWIINKIGHRHCMSLVLFATTARFIFYSKMTNPAWVLLIETLNGMMYALGRAVTVSYSKMISPPSTHHTILGLLGLFDCIGLSLGGVLAAHVYEYHGGVWLFRSFSFGSAFICILHVLFTIFWSKKN